MVGAGRAVYQIWQILFILLQKLGVQTGSGMAEGGNNAGGGVAAGNARAREDANAPLAGAFAALDDSLRASTYIHIYTYLYLCQGLPTAS